MRNNLFYFHLTLLLNIIINMDYNIPPFDTKILIG
jgi:hypothetical protein